MEYLNVELGHGNIPFEEIAPIVLEFIENKKDSIILGELDFTTERASFLYSEVFIRKVSHIIKNIRIENNKILADIETVKTNAGKYIDEVGINNINFSMRGLKSHNTNKINIITWDANKR